MHELTFKSSEEEKQHTDFCSHLFRMKLNLKLVLTTPYCSNMFRRGSERASFAFKILKSEEINWWSPTTIFLH